MKKTPKLNGFIQAKVRKADSPATVFTSRAHLASSNQNTSALFLIEAH